MTAKPDKVDAKPADAAATEATPPPPPRRRHYSLGKFRPQNLRRINKLLLLLGTSEAAVSVLPRITQYIDCVLKLPRDTVIAYLAMSTDPDATAWMATYEREDIPDSIREVLPYEAVCAASGVSTSRFMECLATQIIASGATRSAITAAIHHPEVVEATIGYALTQDGISDRNTLHKAVGFLPMPKGATTTIQIQQNAVASAAAATFEAPRPEQTVRRLVDRFHKNAGEPSTIQVPAAALTEGEESEEVPASMPGTVRESVMVVVPAQASSRQMARRYQEHERAGAEMEDGE
jgi:hypothetical protein